MQQVDVSTVTPVYSGESCLEGLVAALADVRAEWERSGGPLRLVEAIFVDDAAIDGSAAVLGRLRKTHSWVRVVTLSKNFGQHPATIAGVLHASGSWVVTLDEDLQHEPRRIEALLRTAIEQGADVVYAKPEGRVHRRGYRDLASRLYKGLLARITGNPHIRDFNSFRLVRGAVARAAGSVCGHETYFDVSLCWFTESFASVSFDMTDARYAEAGRSGYSLRKLLSHARRLIVSSQAKVLRAGALAGVLALLTALAVLAWVLVNHTTATGATAVPVPGWLSTFVALLFFGGLSCFLLGVALEYLTNIVLHTQGKPPFFVVDRSLDAVLKRHFEGQETREPAPAHSAS